jgi:hypothetical protein
MLPALGALAPVHPPAAAYLFDRDCLVLLGTCVVPLGAPPSGTPVAVQVTVEYAEAGTINIEVPYGSIEVIPLRPEQRASLRVKPSAGFRIGTDEPGKPVQTKPGEEIKGGLIGLIIDARGRPLVLPSAPQERISRLLAWGQALRAYAAQEDFSLTPETSAAPPGPQAMAPLPPAEPLAGGSRFNTNRLRTGMLNEGSIGRAPSGMLPTLPGDLPGPVPDPGLLPPTATMAPEQTPTLGGNYRTPTGPLDSSRPGTRPLESTPRPPTTPLDSSGLPRRRGNTGKLNLPTVGEARKGTGPLDWQKPEDES